jgi:hypothetical protein
MKKFINKPSIDMYVGIVVDKDTKIEYKNDNVDQKIENLVMKSITKVIGDGYESEYHTTVQLKEGDILIFEENGRGYIKPVEEFVTIGEAIKELENIKDLDKEV